MNELHDYIAKMEKEISGDGFAEEAIAFARKLLSAINADAEAKAAADRGLQETAFRIVSESIDWRAEGEDRRFWLSIVRGKGGVA